MDPRTVELVEALCFHADWICSDTQAEKEVKVTGGCCRGGGHPGSANAQKRSSLPGALKPAKKRFKKVRLPSSQ